MGRHHLKPNDDDWLHDDGEDVEITLLYIRAQRTHPQNGLEAQLETLVARYAPSVALIAFEAGDIPEAVASLFPELLSPWVGLTPMVLVLRRGELIGEAIGGSLPMRELDSVVRCAVEWPA